MQKYPGLNSQRVCRASQIVCLKQLTGFASCVSLVSVYERRNGEWCVLLTVSFLWETKINRVSTHDVLNNWQLEPTQKLKVSIQESHPSDVLFGRKCVTVGRHSCLIIIFAFFSNVSQNVAFFSVGTNDPYIWSVFKSILRRRRLYAQLLCLQSALSWAHWGHYGNLLAVLPPDDAFTLKE